MLDININIYIYIYVYIYIDDTPYTLDKLTLVCTYYTLDKLTLVCIGWKNPLFALVKQGKGERDISCARLVYYYFLPSELKMWKFIPKTFRTFSQ